MMSKVDKWIAEAEAIVKDNPSRVVETCLFCGRHRFSASDKNCECWKKIRSIMTGKEIYEKIKDLHTTYVESDEDDLPRPKITLTCHQICKVVDYLGWRSKDYNKLQALAAGDMNRCDIETVIVERK